MPGRYRWLPVAVGLLIATPIRAEETASADAWLASIARRLEADLQSTACIGGLDVPACQTRLIRIVDSALDFGGLADAMLSGLPVPEAQAERARFRTALRGMLVGLWRGRLSGEAEVGLRLGRVDGGRVKTTLTHGGDAYEVELELSGAHGGPRIINISVDGADLVHTWRPRFRHTLEHGGWGKLIERLER